MSAPAADSQKEAVNKILGEIGATEIPTLKIYNKIDRLGERPQFPWGAGSGRVATSAKTGAGLDDLRREIVTVLNKTPLLAAPPPRTGESERIEVSC